MEYLDLCTREEKNRVCFHSFMHPASVADLYRNNNIIIWSIHLYKRTRSSSFLSLHSDAVSWLATCTPTVAIRLLPSSASTIILDNKTKHGSPSASHLGLSERTAGRSVEDKEDCGGRRKRHPPRHDWWEGKSKGYTHNTCIVTQRHAHEPTSQPESVRVWAQRSTETHNIRDRLNSISKLNTSSVAVVVSVGTDRSLVIELRPSCPYSGVCPVFSWTE